MGAHAAGPVRGTRRDSRDPQATGAPGVTHASRASWAIPLTLGVVYGLYTAFMARDSAPLTWGDVWLGVVCGVILTAIAYAVGRAGHRLDPGPRALAFAVPFGIAMGFLFSLGGGSVLTSVVLALVLFAAMLVSAYYVFYSRTP